MRVFLTIHWELLNLSRIKFVETHSILTAGLVIFKLYVSRNLSINKTAVYNVLELTHATTKLLSCDVKEILS